MSAQVNQFETSQAETTTDANFKTIMVINTTTNSCAGFTVNISAIRLSDGASQSWLGAVQYKNVNGTATATLSKVGTTIGVSADKTALNSTDFQATQSGSLVFIQVKGLAATNMVWSCKIDGAEVYNLT